MIQYSILFLKYAIVGKITLFAIISAQRREKNSKSVLGDFTEEQVEAYAQLAKYINDIRRVVASSSKTNPLR